MNKPLSSLGPGRKDFKPKGRFGPIAVAVLVAFHAVVIYGLATGLGSGSIEIVKKKVLDATIVQEIKLPPPPPPPPPKIVPPRIRSAPPPKAPPPPAYVPPPEVTPPATTSPAITAVQNTNPAPPPPAAPAPVAPKAPAVEDIGVVCPTQVQPEVPQKAIDDGINGTVKVEVHIRNGRVAETRFISGPRVYYSAVRAALSQYRCTVSGDDEVVATQDFAFQIKDPD